jgi:hypothetical protein
MFPVFKTINNLLKSNKIGERSKKQKTSIPLERFTSSIGLLTYLLEIRAATINGKTSLKIFLKNKAKAKILLKQLSVLKKRIYIFL